MKHRIFCFLMVCIFTISTAQPFMNADAAELWNKGSHSKKSGKKTYYNKSKSSHKKSTHSLFNRRGVTSKVENRTSTYRSGAGYGFYTEVRMSKQVSSRQWSKMSSAAVRNRQNDVDFALQQEYTILKNIAKKMNKSTKKQQASRYQNYKKHQKEVARYKRNYAQSKLNEEIQRDKAYAKLTKGKGWRSRKSSKKSGYSSVMKKNSTGLTNLKKPKKLFNDIH